VLGVVSLVAACGGGSGPADGITNVPGSKPVNTLTDSEATQWCTDFVKWSKAVIDSPDEKVVNCQLVGTFSGTGFGPTGATFDKTKCASAFDACMAAPPADAGTSGDGGTTSTPDCSKAKADLAACTATVAQVDQCEKDTATALHTQAALGKSICDSVNLEAGPTKSSSQPTSCTSLPAGCRGSSSSSSGGSSDGGLSD